MAPNPYANAARLPLLPEVDLGQVLPGALPRVLEIGSGRGQFTVSLAAAEPGWAVLALEVRRKYAHLLDTRLRARGLGNARCFAEDAGEVLPRLRPDGAFRRVAIHFPDPWWKKRHSKRLVVQDALVLELARLVEPGGEVFVQTDVDSRAEEYRARFDAVGAFVNTAGDGVYVGESPFAPHRSNREARALTDGLPIYRLLYRRR
ncbi:MAG: tRNA (guanine-N7)-methyltransferase [Deltaproteobacteria bacterium]|nr:tRNA (guanine-N7)-methyltransferase [Deltaproteobacteria bacterium]